MARPKLHKREDTLRRALSFFWKNGFSGSSTRELGQALEMHPGSIYSAFGSKEQLYSEVIQFYAQESGKAFDAHLQDSNFFTGLQLYLQEIVLSDQHPCTCFLAKTFSSQLECHQDLVAKSREFMSLFRTDLKSRLERAQREGEIKADIDLDAFASLLQTQIMGLRCLADSTSDHDIVQDTITSVIDLLKMRAKA